jgi:hypothetical protein
MYISATSSAALSICPSCSRTNSNQKWCCHRPVWGAFHYLPTDAMPRESSGKASYHFLRYKGQPLLLEHIVLHQGFVLGNLTTANALCTALPAVSPLWHTNNWSTCLFICFSFYLTKICGSDNKKTRLLAGKCCLLIFMELLCYRRHSRLFSVDKTSYVHVQLPCLHVSIV